MIKPISPGAHGVLDYATVGATLLAPRRLGFSRHRGARGFFLRLTALTAVVAALTDWE